MQSIRYFFRLSFESRPRERQTRKKERKKGRKKERKKESKKERKKETKKERKRERKKYKQRLEYLWRGVEIYETTKELVVFIFFSRLYSSLMAMTAIICYFPTIISRFHHQESMENVIK